ncbi:MAG: hypothetical protein Q4E39_01835 [bacterium]|nr:hypothetical protein [bacterium]
MFQLLFGLGVDSFKGTTMMDFFRLMFSTFDEVVYTLIGFTYNIIFNIADSSIISSDVIKDFFSRVQLVLGVIMIFKISVSLMQYVISPDMFEDKKTGFGQIITRIVTMLAMLTAIVPLNIPTSATQKNSYNSYLNQHGLLFGTLYSLQHRILKGNTIGKIILGTNRNSITNTYDGEESTVDYTEDSDMGNSMAAYILKNFITINYREKVPETEEEAENEQNYMCSPSSLIEGAVTNLLRSFTVPATLTIINPAFVSVAVFSGTVSLIERIKEGLTGSNIGYYYNVWMKTNDPGVVTSLVNTRCSNGYAFAYFPIVSTICGLLLLVTLALSCLDIAVRAIKLVILRLISPIAIISYVDPKAAEKGAFGNWVKLLITTYLDLFIRLAILYFVIYLVDIIIHGGLTLVNSGGFIGAFSTIIVIIGLFWFARQAPKFIRDALGLKGMMSWSGFSAALAGTGTLRAGGSLADAFYAAKDTAKTEADAFNQGKRAPSMFQNYSQSKDNVAKMLTGDNNMTYAKMRRNQRKLDHDLMSNQRADQIHAKRFDLEDDATRAAAMYDSFEKGTLSNAQMDSLARQFGRFNETTGNYELDDAGRQRAREYLLQDKINKKSAAGKWAKYDDDVQSRIKAAGREQSYEDKYRTRLNYTEATLDDLRNPETLSSMFDQGAIQGVKNVVGAVSNANYDRKKAKEARRNDRIAARYEKQQQSNRSINDSRR